MKINVTDMFVFSINELNPNMSFKDSSTGHRKSKMLIFPS